MDTVAEKHSYSDKKANKKMSKWLDIKILFWFVFATIFAIIVRYQLFPFETDITVVKLNSIIFDLKDSGKIDFNNLKQLDVNYAYIYLLSIGSMIGSKTVITVKLINTIFDLFLALGVWAIVKNYTNKKIIAISAYTLMLFTPSILLVSGLWGQSETIVASILIWMLYSLLKGRVVVAVLLFSVAFSLKWIAIFLLPILLIWVFSQKKVVWLSLVLIPLIYFVFLIPVIMQGGNINDLVNLYQIQSQNYSSNINYLPNFNSLITANYSQNSLSVVDGQSINVTSILIGLGNNLYIVVFAFIVWLGVVLKPDWNWMQTIRFSLFSSLVFPFMMTKMQSRYFILASVLSILYIFLVPKKYWYLLVIEIISVVIISASMLGIAPFIDKGILLVSLLTLIACVGYEIVINFEYFKTLQEKVAILSSKYMLKSGK